MSQGVLGLIEKKLELKRVEPLKALQNCPNLEQWTKLSELVEKYTEVVKIALVGKYFALDHTTGEAKVRIFTDAYSSVIKALKHAATHSERKLEILFVVADHLEDDAPADKRKAAWDLVKQAQYVPSYRSRLDLTFQRYLGSWWFRISWNRGKNPSLQVC